jgi:hypothetical protein
LNKKRLVLVSFLVLVTLSAVATATLVFNVSVSSGIVDVCVSGAGDLDGIAYEAIAMGKPKPGGWT